MNKHAIEHLSDSRYCFAVGGLKYRIRLKTARDDNIEKIELLWNSWCSFYSKQKVTQMYLAHQDELFDYYEVEIENEEPGYAYVFKIYCDDGKVFFYSEYGISEDYDFSTCFLDEFLATFPNDVDTIKNKKGFNGRVIYQIFPERFARSQNKKNTSYINMDWDEEEVRNNRYMGGDINGIIEKLPYLKQLGVGAIYLCPVHPSPSAHKYDVNDYFDIDPMFGTKEDFAKLVEEAHKVDITIIMDMVFNHTCFYNDLMQDVCRKGKKSKYYDWYFIDGDKPDYKKRNYLTFADVAMMPKLNTNNPKVMEYFKKVVVFWAEKYHVDGFRLDVAFEVSHKFWRELKRALMEVNPDIIFYGEQWLNSESRLDNSEWDSVMNYPVRLVLIRYFNENKTNKYLSDNLNRLLMRYKDPINHNMINLLDSHDTERFLTTLKGNRDFYLMAYAILMFYPGCPELYYGDEIFEEGKNDPYCRKGMKWNSSEYQKADYQLFVKLLHLREYQSLRDGEYRIHEKDNILFMKRYNNNEELVLALYKGDNEKQFKCDNIILKHNYQDGKFLKSGFVVYKNK